MPDTSLTIEEILPLLVATPMRIAALTDGLTPVQLRATPDPDEWSANDILAHLRACADMWGKYILRILDEEHPTIRAVNPRAWLRKTNYLEQEFEPSLRVFSTQRAELVQVLQPLPIDAWSRAATVKGAGAPLEKTVQDYAERLARHERVHLIQIEQVATVRKSIQS